MLIAIIADIHDNLVNLNKFLDWSKKNKIKKIICAGDLTNSETLNALGKKFKNSIYLVKGNIELYGEKELKKFKNINYFGKTGRFKIDGQIAGLCHEAHFIDKVLHAGHCDIIFYGHSHKPSLEEIDGFKLVNPGELGGMWGKATFAVWNTKTNKLELKLLELI